jgi:hypothetical protein
MDITHPVIEPIFKLLYFFIESVNPLSMRDEETIILLNQEEMREGYFTFGTSVPREYKRLIKRIGGVNKLKSLNLSKTPSGVVTWYDCKVPIEYYFRNTFAIGKRRVIDSPTHGFRNAVRRYKGKVRKAFPRS